MIILCIKSLLQICIQARWYDIPTIFNYISSTIQIIWEIQVDQQVTAPRLTDDPGAVQGVDMIHTVHDLVGTNAVRISVSFDVYSPYG